MGTADKSLPSTGQMSLGLPTCKRSPEPRFQTAMSCVVDSPVRTSPQLVEAMALMVLEVACGGNSRGLWARYNHGVSLSRMWPVVRADGLMMSCARWSDLDMQRYLSRVRRIGLDSPTCAPACLLLPTPTASHYGSQGNARGQRQHKRKPSLWYRAKTQGGKLNPRFVEWMMGFPIGWTIPDSGH